MKKKIIILISVLFISFVMRMPVFAHPGNTDEYGCHTCRTNCEKWGLSYGEYHCHNSKTGKITVKTSSKKLPHRSALIVK